MHDLHHSLTFSTAFLWKAVLLTVSIRDTVGDKNLVFFFKYTYADLKYRVRGWGKKYRNTDLP